MQRWTWGIALASACWLACGGDDGGSPADVAGVYEVTYHTVNEDACDAEGPANTDYSHFQLLADNFPTIHAVGRAAAEDRAPAL